MLAAGRLRQLIDIVRPTRTSTGKGGFTTASTPIAQSVPAEVLALSASEKTQEKVLRSIRFYRVTIRYRADVAPTDQIVVAGEAEPLNIRSAIDLDNKRAALVIHADTEA